MNENKESSDKFDLRPIGAAIKSARKAKKLTREAAAEQFGITASHLGALENKGVCPSLRLLIKIMTYFNLSFDEYLYPDRTPNKSSIQLQIANQIRECDEAELYIVKSTLEGISGMKKMRAVK